MIQAAIEAMLNEKIGLSANIIGSNEIGRAIEQRMLACNFSDLETYLYQLQTSNKELEELIELAIVPETWFFRDWEPFVFLEQYIRSEWMSTQSYRILRVLSVPCSSGEEPYSIAMTLLNAGLSPNQFQIDAVDISKKSLLRAKQAIYGQNSFRGKNLDFQKIYFTKMGEQYQLCDRVKNAVNFIHGNLIEPKFLSERSAYDIIFCRNVLIYFDSSHRNQSIQNLNRLLTDEGLLFLGHAETGQILESGFVSVRHPFAFAYRKKGNKNDQLKAQELAPLPNNGNFNLIEPKSSNKIREIPKPGTTKNNLREKPPSTEPKTLPLSKVPPLNLETARKLADRGKLDEAAKICENYLKQNSTSVEAYILLGEIYQAQALEDKAEQCFQKAIYLQPNNYEALLHLSLLKEHSGDAAGATVLRQRIQRLQK